MRNKKEGLKLLKSVPLFEGLSGAELKRLLAETEERYFSPGQDLVVEGQKGGPFFLITEGRAKLIMGGRTRKTLGPGAAVGEMSLIDGLPRSATVRADTNIKALAIKSWNFLAILEESWPITKKIMAELSRRVRALEKVEPH
ncbi:MAG TPA: cyclic nucleotide-binding domain-containing protein [Actinomycetota bacterium]|nr:cyclic nucleotide-binding domain-containing protein [Actinomycetota bacterium]